MAVINFFDDIFSEVSKIETYDAGVELKKIINKYIEEKDSITLSYEVYDIETGETSYIIPEVTEYKTVCLVNGEEKELSYKTQENDIIDFILIPQSDASGAQLFNYIGGGLMVIAGLITSIATGWTGVGLTVGISLMTSGVTMIVGQLFSDIYNQNNSSSSSKSNTLKDAESVYGLSGGSNQEIIDHRYPVVLGKHLTNPYIVGSYYNETITSDLNGNDGGQYLSQLYCVGYGPLKLTDFKIGDILLAYNRSTDNFDKNSIMHGKLQGYNEADTGDILKKWKNNDVQLEILQAGSLLSNSVNKYGTIYPQTVEQIEPNANLLTIVDGDIEEVANRTYLGTSIPNGFKTNSVRFSRSCPQKLEVELDFPNGLYGYRSYTKNKSEIYYYDIPICFAIQWRYVKDGQESSNADSSEGWNTFDYIKIADGNNILPSIYTFEEKTYEYRSQRGKKDYVDTSDIDSVKNFSTGDNFIGSKVFGLNAIHNGSSVLSESHYYLKGLVGLSCTFRSTLNSGGGSGGGAGSTGAYSSSSGSSSSSNGGAYTYDSMASNYVVVELSAAGIAALVDTSTGKLKSGVSSVVTNPSWFITQPSFCSEDIEFPCNYSSDSYAHYSSSATSTGGTYVGNTSYSYRFGGKGVWSYFAIRELLNKDSTETYVRVFDETTDEIINHPVSKEAINVNERRYVAVKEFTAAECEKMINYGNENESSIDSVEVRVLRLSPCYFEELHTSYHDIPDNWSGMKYNDLAKWTALRTFSFDKDKFTEALKNNEISAEDMTKTETMKNYPLRPIDDEDLDKFTYVALRLKQDAAETGGSSLNQLSCIATNLGPNYDAEQKKWYPEYLTPTTRHYHKYDNSDGETVIDDISEQEYKDSKLKRLTITPFLDTTTNAVTSLTSKELNYYLSSNGLYYKAIESAKLVIFNIDGTEYIPEFTDSDLKAGSLIEITDGIYLGYGDGNTLSGYYVQKTDDETHTIYVYKNDSSIRASEYYKTTKGNDLISQIKNEIFNTYSQLGLTASNGIDYRSRVTISGASLIEKGWTSATSSMSYFFFPQIYTNEKIIGKSAPTIGVVLSPIETDGTILTPTELQTKANSILIGTADTDNILLATFDAQYYSRNGVIVTPAAKIETDIPVYVREQCYYYSSYTESLANIYFLKEDETVYQNLFNLMGTSSDMITEEKLKAYITDLGLSYWTLNNEISTLKQQALGKLLTQMFLLSSTGINEETDGVKYKLLDTIEKKYCSQNVAAQALYSIMGPQVGIDAKIYDDVNMKSFTDLYNFCENVTDGTTLEDDEEQQEGYTDRLVHMKFTCNGIISSEIKLESLLEKILLCGRSYIKRDEQNRYEVLIGKPVDYPVGVLNQQNVVSKSNTRSLEDEISGYLVQFVDETDNYTQNNIYIMNDGEDYRNPTHEISSLSLQYVTNREQVYSLARFNLVAKLYQKEAYTRTVGRMGYNISLGDVFLMQDDSLLIGKEHGARIANLIKSDDGKYLYGIEIDDPITFTGADNFGCTIVQPEKYGASRCVTLCFCDANGCQISDTEYIEPELGITNKLYFKKQIALEDFSADEETAEIVQVLPKIGNLVAFGNINAITEKVQVMGIKPKEKDQFELTLVPYNPDLYNMGTKLPVFTSNMTLPSREEMQVDFNDYTRKDETESTAQDVSAKLMTYVQESIPGSANPENLTTVIAVAYKDCISLSCVNPGTSASDTIDYLTWKITRKDGTEFTVTSSGTEFNYNFDRETDGYPEREDLVEWTVSVINTNSSGLTSEWTTPVSVNASNYGTWKLTELQSIDNYVQDRTISLSFALTPRSDNKVVYGNTKYKIKIQRVCSKDQYDASISFDFDKYNDGDNWYTPSTSQNPFPVTKTSPTGTEITITNVDNYKQFKTVYSLATEYDSSETYYIYNESADTYSKADPQPTATTFSSGTYYLKTSEACTDWLETTSPYTQTMPLIGQGEKNKIVATTYGFKIVAYNESGNESEELLVYKTALCTSISDIVNANSYYNDLYVKRLSAISANVGLIEKGGFGDFNNQTNYWALSTLEKGDYTGLDNDVFEGEFRVGSETQYIKVSIVKDTDGNPILDADGKYQYKVEVSAGNIDLTSNTSGFNGGTYVYDQNDTSKRNRLKLSANGVTIQKAKTDSEGNIILDENGDIVYIDLGRLYGDSNGNLTFTNEPSDTEESTLPKFGIEVTDDETAVIYHLDEDLKDTTGENSENITFNGVLSNNSDYSILQDMKGIFIGNIEKSLSEENADVIFWNRSNNIRLGDHLLNFSTGKKNVNANDWNTLLNCTYFKNIYS